MTIRRHDSVPVRVRDVSSGGTFIAIGFDIQIILALCFAEQRKAFFRHGIKGRHLAN